MQPHAPTAADITQADYGRQIAVLAEYLEPGDVADIHREAVLMGSRISYQDMHHAVRGRYWPKHAHFVLRAVGKFLADKRGLDCEQLLRQAAAGVITNP